ncbi:hypothetical protein FNV43_RR15009 [Rhamnella rubrinervis]|uniref:C2 domain-containing protein n=1 Tax=Rhamnella rubrinervis TaxID=2594499 RepID=A0A8K0GWF6_9ROSA|nr:hypothetical protein FNV43_RR15009 [Rhamnella rubrinervis]
MDSSLENSYADHGQAEPRSRHILSSIPNPFSSENSESRHTFRHLSNSNQEQKQNVPPAAVQSILNYGVNEMKSEPHSRKVVRMHSGSSSQPIDYALKETSPYLGGGQIVGGQVIRGDRPVITYDLVEKMQYLFVRVVKARDLPTKDVTGSLDPYVEVKVGNYRRTTKNFEKKQNTEWNMVFPFARDNVQSSVLDVVVKDKDILKDDFVGFVRFDLNKVPTRVPPASPLAPEWYRLADKDGDKKKGELMLAVWYGTQADEAFPDAWHSDAVGSDDSSAAFALRSKVYLSPRIWYVRVNVIEAQDLIVSEKSRFPDAYVKVRIGNHVLRTERVQTPTLNPIWNEDLMLAAAEPFEEALVVTVEDCIGPNKVETIGRVEIPLNSVEWRADDRFVRGKWFHLEKSMSAATDGDQKTSRLHLCVFLDGGYHDLDESTNDSSDLQPTAKPLVGILELGILNADGLHPLKTRDGRGRSDTYCVAKYGHKWVRTRTVVNSLNPKYNEQYTWEVYDPATVLTVGVFDNSQFDGSDGSKDVIIGKVRIRISTLETSRVYTHSHVLLVLHPSGVQKMGELHLAIRFSCTSLANMMFAYLRPLLPQLHYVRPLTMMQQHMLRHQAANIVASRFSGEEPPLRKEVVEYMSDAHSHIWSLRRSKATYFRLMSVLQFFPLISIFSGLFLLGKWFGEDLLWKNPRTTVLAHILFVMLVCSPKLILPTVFLYMFLIAIWNFQYRPRSPPHIDIRFSFADAAHPDELDEEFDTFPTSRDYDIVRMRYDRLRSIAGRLETQVADIATQGERLQALVSWQDPRVTVLFLTFCLGAAIVLYVTPFRVLVLLVGFNFLRHPRFRIEMPSARINIFRRLPARTDSIL